jgi:hypothetical protein
MQVVGWLGLGMELGCLREECRPPNGAPERMVLMRARFSSITSSTSFTERIVAKCFDPLARRPRRIEPCLRLDRTSRGASALATLGLENYREQVRLGVVPNTSGGEHVPAPFFTSASTSFAASST